MEGHTSIELTLENFRGPIDLLLSLVKQSEISIEEVLISAITAQYLKKVDQEHFDHSEGGDFIVSAALLLQIKSQALFPLDELQMGVDDIEGALTVLDNLCEYSNFKEMASYLRQHEEEGIEQYGRPERAHERVSLPTISLQGLTGRLQKLIEKVSETKAIVQDEWRVDEAIDRMVAILEETGRLDWSDLFAPQKCRLEKIVIFLALLELMKTGKIKVFFQDNRGVIEGV